MRVLMAGSHGMIGSALLDHLTGRGDEVVRLVRGTPSQGEIAWDPPRGWVDREVLDDLGPFDAAVNLAGSGIGDRRWTAAWRQSLVESRLQTTGLVAQVVAELRPAPSVLVNASAVGYYGDRGDEVLTEASAPGDGFLADLCRRWEAAADPARAAGARTVVTRSGVVLARKGGALRRQLPLFRLALGGRLGSGRQFVSWITLRDEVLALVRALDDERVDGPVNLVAPQPVRNAELTRAIGRALGRPTVLAVPEPALKLALGGEMASEVLLASQRAEPAVLEDLGHVFAHPEISAALRAVLDDDRG
jgi:uncharacterized protein